MATHETRRLPDAARKRMRTLAYWLDSAIPLPGGRSIGIESIVGLIPGVGDMLGALASGYIVLEGIKMGAPKSVLIKMILNVVLETSIGVVPVVGDIFDMYYKSNQRNVNLLLGLEDPAVVHRHTNHRTRNLIFAGVIVMLVLVFWMLR